MPLAGLFTPGSKDASGGAGPASDGEALADDVSSGSPLCDAVGLVVAVVAVVVAALTVVLADTMGAPSVGSTVPVTAGGVEVAVEETVGGSVDGLSVAKVPAVTEKLTMAELLAVALGVWLGVT